VPAVRQLRCQMPAAVDLDVDEFGSDPGDDADDLEFNAAAWAPDNREYGLFYLMVIRQGLMADWPEKLTKPSEVEDLKFVDSRIVNDHEKRMSSASTKPPRRDNAETVVSDDEADDVSEGEPYEESDVAAWPGKKLSWWRVHAALGEELVVRQGLSLASAEIMRLSPGDAVQQAGVARMLRNGRCRGCIRLPIKPRGWVTADATRAGGPRYVVSATAPRWRVVYSSPNSREADAIIRSDPALDSSEVASLWCGDIVEQAGPPETRGQGILRMPVTSLIVKRNDVDHEAHGKNSEASSSKVLGYVTLDASSAGGPVFFKPAPDADNKRRRRRPGWS